ncbi:DUF4245 domain-containing protein [Glaciihabitans arcticus]|nr:DUF4245 domain-containing protein [Glaciihabitans arcticus]
MATKEPRVVADLGRPETPEETAARKAETSRTHRASQTVVNLAWSLGVSVAVMLVLVLVVVRPDLPDREPVDYTILAEQYESQAGQPLLSPELPQGWYANKAELETGTDGVTTWAVGFITPSNQYISLNQGVEANPTWLGNQLTPTDRPALEGTGGEQLDDVAWTVYDNRTADDAGNYAYAMSAELDESIVVLRGTADANEFRTLATALGAQR